MGDMPKPVTFTYLGLIATDRGRNKQHALGNIGRPLHWGIWRDNFGVFSLSTSTQPTTETAGETVIERQKFFVNVYNVTRNAGVDAPLHELGGLTVRQTLARLNDLYLLRGNRPTAQGASELLEPVEPPKPVSGLLHRPPVTRRVILERPRELSAQYRADERVVTARQVNLFHLRFIETVMDDLPRLVALDYQGLVATDCEQDRPRKAGDIGLPLSWALGHDGRAVCTFWLSTQPTPETAAEVPIEGQKLFVNVDSVIGNSGLDIPLPELGGLTVRQRLAKLNKPWPAPPTLEELKKSSEEGLPLPRGD